jgi:hypothetical protein
MMMSPWQSAFPGDRSHELGMQICAGGLSQVHGGRLGNARGSRAGIPHGTPLLPEPLVRLAGAPNKWAAVGLRAGGTRRVPRAAARTSGCAASGAAGS